MPDIQPCAYVERDLLNRLKLCMPKLLLPPSWPTCMPMTSSLPSALAKAAYLECLHPALAKAAYLESLGARGSTHVKHLRGREHRR